MTKIAQSRAYQNTIDAMAIPNILIDEMVCLSEVPKQIVLDYNVPFTGEYWMNVVGIFQVKLIVSTAFHSKLSDHSENSNKIATCCMGGFTTIVQVVFKKVSIGLYDWG